MLFLGILVFLAGSFYAVTLLRFAAGFHDVIGRIPGSADPLPFVSVIVPARNEEQVIEACLRSILGNIYPHDRMEVILVDDGSTDATLDVARQLESDHALKVISADSEGGGGGKQAALQAGISMAQGEIILTTDADCRVGPGWIGAMIRTFDANTGYVAGPVVFSPARSIFDRILALEFVGLIAVGAGAIGRNRPILSNGANASFRREAFEAVGGFGPGAGHGPGDDDILMQRIRYETDWEVRFCAAPEAVVSTLPPRDVPEFMQQRLRWGSTAPRYRHGNIRSVLTAIYSFYVLLLGCVLAAPFVSGIGVILAGGLVLKILPEAVLLVSAVRQFGGERWLRWFLPAQLVHVPYVVFIPAAGTLAGYQWKGRKLRS